MDETGFESRHGKKNTFLFTQTPSLSLGPAHPPTHLVLGVLFPKAKLSGREMDHQPLPGPEVKNEWIYTS